MTQQTTEIEKLFEGGATISKEELADYLKSKDIHANDESIRKRISRYKKAGLIISIKKGVYALSKKPVYVHPSDKLIKKLSGLFFSRYPDIDYCVWSSAWLYDFTVHQPVQFFYVFETEPDMVEILFNLLKDNGYHVFLNPDERTMQLYVMGMNNPVVIKPLVSRAPLVRDKALRLPSIEKMLVDAYIDKALFYFIQGNEMQNIFKLSFSKYSINISTLLNYATRRGYGNEIKDFLKNSSSNLNKIL